MAIRLKDVFTRTDWLKISLLALVSLGCWFWVWHEYQKPFLVTDPEPQDTFEEEILNQN